MQSVTERAARVGLGQRCLSDAAPEALCEPREAAPGGAADTLRVLLVGNPNAGKSTLFNALSGGRARVGNYPGVTVERRSGRVRLPGGGTAEVVDLPGTYSLTARSSEERIAAECVLEGGPATVAVAVVDAGALGRHLYLPLQLLEGGVPTVIALNMMDEAGRNGVRIDTRELGRQLGVEVVPIVASRAEGLRELLAAIEREQSSFGARHERLAPSAAAADRKLEPVEAAIERWRGPLSAERRRAWARWAVVSLGDDSQQDVPAQVREAAAQVLAGDSELRRRIIEERYARIDEIVSRSVSRDAPFERGWTDRMDAIVTHPGWGLAMFLTVMVAVFEALFSWATPAIALIERAIGAVQGGVATMVPSGPFRDLLTEGVVGGVGNVLVFVPQIALLFLMVGFLEDCGYLARVAFVIDRLMARVGLHGRAFVPLLSGFACAVPAVLATRTIENRRDRLITMLSLPLMSCSARLPVYVLVTATVFAGSERLWGVLSPGAVVLFAMYTLSMVATLGAAAVLRRTAFRGPRASLVLELPPYRWPGLRTLLMTTWSRVRVFLVDAGTIILAFTIVLWALLSFPTSPHVAAEYAEARQQVVSTVSSAEQPERLAELEAREAAAQLEYSLAGRLGRGLEPVLEPLGFDWRLGIGLIGAFAAREVFVSTLGIIFGIGEADEDSVPLRETLRSAKRPDGSILLTPLVGVALMVFFVFACQCMSTLAAVRRESGSWKWPLFLFAYMSALAYGATWLVYQGGQALQWGVG